jgi:nitrite reductase/ring-hydroxylating ferredoxin subunit
MPRFVKLASLDELSPGGMKETEIDGRIIALFNVGGEISAIDGICPHQGGPLAEGELTGTTVTCPWHGWRFDIKTGQTLGGSKLCQTVYPVKLEGNDVMVEVP